MEQDRENGIGVWEFNAGGRVWIAARSETEAKVYYDKTYGDGEPDDEEPLVTEIHDLDREEIIDVPKYEQDKAVYISYRNLIRGRRDFPTTVADDHW